MSWIISTKQYIPAIIGEEFGGGYFAGYISHTADGSPTHALIVAPRATGASGIFYPINTDLQWKTSNTTTTGTTSNFDGAVNTAAMVTAGIAAHPAANFCVGLNIGGFTDWYLPSPAELNIAYFNLKPDNTNNAVNRGANVYAVPQRNNNWTANYPRQTAVTLFNTSSQAFISANHWTSAQTGSADSANYLFFGNGETISTNKVNSMRVRAFRKIALPQL
jgi:hypothetical protein